MSIVDLNSAYDARESRGVFGLRTNLWLRRMYFSLFREKYLKQVDCLIRGIPGIIVDLGCNAGDKTGSLLRAFPERAITGVDIHENSIRKGTERYKGNSRVTMKVGNALELCSIVQGQIACVFTSQMLHHLDFEDRLVCLDELYGKLPEGGIFIVSDTFMENDSTLGSWVLRGYSKIARSNAYYNISPEQMREEAEFVGFKILKVIGSFPHFERLTGFHPTTILIFKKPEKST